MTAHTISDEAKATCNIKDRGGVGWGSANPIYSSGEQRPKCPGGSSRRGNQVTSVKGTETQTTAEVKW